MAPVTVEDLVNFVQRQESEKFCEVITDSLIEEHILQLIVKLKDKEFKVAIDWCKKMNIYFIHKLFEKIENLDSLKFLEKIPLPDKLDSEKRTWLHIAAKHDRSIDILTHLVTKRGMSIESKDDYDYTPLHYYCQIKDDYNPNVLSLLMKDHHQLTWRSKDDLTPLEFACSNEDNLRKLRGMGTVDIKKLLRTIDNISHGVMEVKPGLITKLFSIDRIWLNLLQKNDKYMLLSYIKNDDKFLDKYFLDQAVILTIIKQCPENGQGIISHIRPRYIKKGNSTDLEKVFTDLTGIKVDSASTPKKHSFINSALFLALITGRFNLVSPLLRCCQFSIVPYAMLVCLICEKLANNQHFPDQVIKDIRDVKDFCEDYAIAVTNRSYNKDLSDKKQVIGKYITQKSDKLQMKSILEVAYVARCIKFLCLPCCQDTLDQTWKGSGIECPRITFWLHSVVHILFLILFSSVVVNHMFSVVCIPEYVCYAYGLGYLIEELRQIYFISSHNMIRTYCSDAANPIDILALILLLIGFILRMTLNNEVSLQAGNLKLFIESRDKYLFVQRLFLCSSLIAFYMRVLYVASINPILGPRLKMIRTMIIKDLMPLLFIFIIFLISFGVTFQSLLFPNSFYTLAGVSSFNQSFIRKDLLLVVGDLFRRITLTIFDFKLTLDEIDRDGNNLSGIVYSPVAVYILLILFIVVVNVMLMNLLIALFSYTVTKIIVESKQWWKSNRYRFIQEYSKRTIAPPPLNIIMIPIEQLILHVQSRKKIINKRRLSENMSLRLLSQNNESPDETSISYYIYQAFAMNGQRYRLLQETKDLEYVKENHFRDIEKKLEIIHERVKETETKMKALEERQKVEKNILKEAIMERFTALETLISSQRR